jgi:hypothetical protein
MHIDRITIIPDVCGGEPTIRGMRITASQVLEMLAGGMKPEEILRDFPYLEQAISMPVSNMPPVTLRIAKSLWASEISRRRESSTASL